MRKKIVGGNWKMNLLDEEVINYVVDFNSKKGEIESEVEIIIFPASLYLDTMISMPDWDIKIGAQNCSQHKSGAFTGEISAEMLRDFDYDCENLHYCLVGHSERRAYFNETNTILAQKVDRLLECELKPIYCCGEELEQRKSESHFEVVKSQIIEGLFHLDEKQILNLVIAYEPVWAIGTGETATSKQAQEMHQFIRETLKEKYNEEVANSISILYGGSCKPSNAKELFSQPDIDGGLIGGASLEVDSFIQIINSI
jgi:triosephosphate isomerase|tara:strand:- start:10664 stop:11431 length:768 start_codon:yes stop_codon:yes gene_type:complete